VPPLRDYPALTLTFTRPADTDRVDLLMAELDGFDVTAVEDLPSHGLRLFFTTTALRERAARHLGNFPDITLTSDEVSDGDWGARSQAAIGAVTVGALTIAPPWAVTSEMRDQADRLITIVPSMGFGTGHHASTRLCLEQLQSIPLRGLRVIDVGTGSGVLAIAAARLGAERVTAIDVDPDALENARENLALNGVADVVTVNELTLAGAASAGPRVDVILANLTGGHLTREAEHFARLALPAARLVVSGFQADESDEVARTIEDAGWTLDGSSGEATWVAMRFVLSVRRPTSPTPSTAR
jgi:ribosomal protein L11 methyltransferase